MLNKFYFYHNTDRNPYQTLALEECVLNHIRPDEIMLYLYSHADTVVIGRNQNAWAECRHETLLADGGKLARRVSGGGAVFHDIGNLNFSFIVGREAYDLTRQLKVILDAVRSFGVEAAFSGRNDITADGRKFSGNAFCFRKDGAFHHGTILMRSSMDKIAKYLAVPKDKIETKGISSVRSRVVNLSELNPDITPDLMARALLSSFQAEYGKTRNYPFTPEIAVETAETEKRNASWDWRFGQSPAFDIRFGTRYPWGGAEFCLNLDGAVVTGAQLYSDSMEPELIAAIPAGLSGVPFRSRALANAVLATPHTPDQLPLLRDLADFLLKQNY
jgi:lipoate-protein ligase A